MKRTSFETTADELARTTSAPPARSAPAMSLASLVSERTPARGRNAVDMLKTLGTRLKSDERAPYDRPEHDDTVNFDDPTDDLILIDEKKS